MSSRPKVAIVVGEMIQPRLLGMFESLAESFDVTVLALDSDGIIDKHDTGLKLRVFESIEDIPGYMRGVEEELLGTSAIIALETSRLSTFQAVRAARKYNIPLGVFSTEYRPLFYEKFENIRAIQYDICNKADVFWASSLQSADALRIDHVAENSIKLLNPTIDTRKFKIDPAGRQRFRKYINLDQNDFVVLFNGDLEKYTKVEDIVAAMCKLKKEFGESASHVKLILAGNGSLAMELKYKSFDNGLGSNIMFLHQTPDPFLADLLNASDIIVSPKPEKTEFHEDFPLNILEAMSCGVVPIVSAGSVGQEIAGDACLVVADNSYQSIYLGLRKIITIKDMLFDLSNKAVIHIHSHFSKDKSSSTLLSEVWGLIESNNERRTAIVDFEELSSKVLRWIREGNVIESMHAIEDALLVFEDSIQMKAKILSLKGDVDFAKGDYDAAMKSYSSSIQMDDGQFKSLRGLGYIAWQSHSNEDALTFFRKSLAINENDQLTILGIGLVYRRLGLNEEALFWLEKAVGAGDSSRAIVALSQACLECSKPQSGIDIIERVIEVTGEKTPLLMSLAQLYINNGDAEAGRQYLEKAMA